MTLKTAFVFPGQGAQTVGMGVSLLEAYPQWVEPIYAVADAVIGTLEDGRAFRQAFLNGPADVLQQTRYTQPALLAVSLAAWQVFNALTQNQVHPVVTAGHSLGEYAAMVASQALTTEDVINLGKIRAQLMHSAKQGAMAAVLGLPALKVEHALLTLDAALGPVVIANDNSAEQQVISGTPTAVAAAADVLKAAGAKRVLPLPVGGAFHSPLMAEAALDYETLIKGATFNTATPPVIMNVDAQPTHEPAELCRKLALQMPSPVRWRETMQTMIETLGVNCVIEFGPGNVLTGLVKRAYPDVKLLNVSDAASAKAAAESFSLANV
ncbi:MAG: ACP S-malonyltransferase [Vampirovibrionales bacterium]|nr:ACP S-malonyltransferase [Vampirovibrionales bacterium]